MYDGMLRLELSRRVKIVGFVDDIGLTITGETPEDIEKLTAETIDIIQTLVKLQLAHHKTEVVTVVSNCRAVQLFINDIGGNITQSTRVLKHVVEDWKT